MAVIASLLYTIGGVPINKTSSFGMMTAIHSLIIFTILNARKLLHSFNLSLNEDTLKDFYQSKAVFRLYRLLSSFLKKSNADLAVAKRTYL